MRTLVLGGTAEARALASELDQRGCTFLSSLAGRVSRPRLPAGQVHVGGFGGIAGLRDFLREEEITHMIDATHPFAATMSAHAATAAGQHIALARLLRPGWHTHPHAATWQWVDDLTGAALATSKLGSHPFLTTGRQSLTAFADLDVERALVRVVDPMRPPHPRWTVVHDRGPYAVRDEVELMTRHTVDVLVTKNSGGDYTSAKLAAAQHLDLPVVIVRRPPVEPDIATFETVEAVLAWLS